MTELLTLPLLHSLSSTSTLLNIFVVSFIPYSWKETFQLSEGLGKKHWKKRKETFLKNLPRKLSKKDEEGNTAKKRERKLFTKIGRKHSKKRRRKLWRKKEEGNYLTKNKKETLKKRERKYSKKEEGNFL